MFDHEKGTAETSTSAFRAEGPLEYRNMLLDTSGIPDIDHTDEEREMLIREAVRLHERVMDQMKKGMRISPEEKEKKAASMETLRGALIRYIHDITDEMRAVRDDETELHRLAKEKIAPTFDAIRKCTTMDDPVFELESWAQIAMENALVGKETMKRLLGLQQTDDNGEEPPTQPTPRKRKAA